MIADNRVVNFIFDRVYKKVRKKTKTYVMYWIRFPCVVLLIVTFDDTPIRRYPLKQYEYKIHIVYCGRPMFFSVFIHSVLYIYLKKPQARG